MLHYVKNYILYRKFLTRYPPPNHKLNRALTGPYLGEQNQIKKPLQTQGTEGIQIIF